MKKFEISLLLGLILAVMLAEFSAFAAVSDEVRKDTLRLHILANSDSDADQALKLKVRDAILKESENLFKTAFDKNNAIEIVDSSLENIKKIATETVKENGYNYTVQVYRTNMMFSTRYYDGFTLPAGMYDAVRVEIGSANGKNWWCVLFPPLCLGAANGGNEKISDTENKKNINEKDEDIKNHDSKTAIEKGYNEDEQKLISGQYEFRFAILDFAEKIKEKM